MAAPGLSEAVTMTIESRSRSVADNVTKNNALLMRMKNKDRVKAVTGGVTILQELEYAENRTLTRYSGYETIDIRPSNVFTAAEYNLRQYAVTVSISGLEELQNSGRERQIELMSSRIDNGFHTLNNSVSVDMYSDGTADGGKQIDGLQAAITSSPSTGTYGGIPRAANMFWRPQVEGGVAATNITAKMQALWLKTCRGSDKPDLIVADNTFYQYFWSSLTDLQRFTRSDRGTGGFQALKFVDADVVADGAQGGGAPANSMFFLNTKYLMYRPHRDRNMVELAKRFATNQDSSIHVIGWAGNMTCSNASLQGRLAA